MRRAFTTAIAALLLTSGLWVFEAAPAHACSCEETTTGSIDNAAGAIIGTIAAIDDVADRWPDENSFVATVDVAIDLKNNVPDQIFIDSYADDGGNCGTSWRTGQEIGVLLYEQENGLLGGGGCGEFGRDLANEYQPPVTTGGLADMIIVGWGDAYRTVAYDADAQPIAYGFQAGSVNHVDVCDDGITLVELVEDWSTGNQTIALRSVSSFAIIAEWPILWSDGPLGIRSVLCEGSSGSSVALDAKEPMEPADIFGTYRVDASGVVAVDEPYLGASFRGPGDDIWPRVQATNGTIEPQEWMQYVVRLDEPVRIEPAQQAFTPKPVGAGLSAAERDGAVIPEAPDDIPLAEAPPAAAAPLPAGSSGLSNTLVFAILAGLVAIAVIVAATLRSAKNDDAPNQ